MLIGALSSIFIMPAASMYPLMTMGYFDGTVSNAGLVQMIYSVGMLVGGSIIGVFGNWKDRMKPLLISYLVIGITFAAGGLLPSNQSGLVWFMILSAFTGIAAPFFDSLLMAMIQQSFPVNQIGRIMGVVMALLSLLASLGLIFTGPIADRIGVENVFVIAGLGIILCAIINWLIVPAKNYDKQLQGESMLDGSD